ncbi:PBP2_Bug_TTT domain containing protein [Burkholderiaceae bacterium]
MDPLKRNLVLGISLACAAFWAQAQTAPSAVWPSKTIRIIVPYPTGGVSDNATRVLAERLTKALGQTVVVENRAGAGGTVGTDIVAKAAPDGYTIGFAGISAFSIGPFVMKVNYDSLKDFSAVAAAMYSPIYLLATSKFSGNSLEDVIALSKAKPGSVTVATSGYGTVGHIMVEQLRKKSGADITHVPYKGGGQIATDALGGQFDLMLANPYANLNNLIAEGKFRVLAVGAPQRLEKYPNVKTFAELGYPEVNMTSFFGFFAPARTPPDVIAKLNTEINRALNDPEIAEKIRKLENLVVTGTPEYFGNMIQKEHAANAVIIKEANIKAE